MLAEWPTGLWGFSIKATGGYKRLTLSRRQGEGAAGAQLMPTLQLVNPPLVGKMAHFATYLPSFHDKAQVLYEAEFLVWRQNPHKYSNA